MTTALGGRRRALIVGCNYGRCGAIRLKGAVNDAYLMCLSLVNLFGFSPSQILLLADEQPSFLKPTARSADVHRSRLPERGNIIMGLRWLTSHTRPGDVLLFYFAGHGLQVDNMSGWEGEGYDEALLPLDCAHTEGTVNAITTSSLRHILMCVESNVQLTIILDCNGGQTLLETSNAWSSIRGVMQKGLWPLLTDVTSKVKSKTC